MKKMKKLLSIIMVIAMLMAFAVPTATAAGEVFYSKSDLSLASGTTHETTWTAPSDGTVTVSITSVNPGIKFWFGDNLPKSATAAKSYDFDVTGGTAYQFKICGYYNWGDASATVSFELSFASASGGSETPVEKAEYEVSTTMLALGDNSLTLLDTAVTTIYEFEPAEAAKYTFTAPAGAILGYWGAGSWFLTNPNSTTNTCEWECTAVGQSAFIGVSGVEGSFNLNVAKTGEYVDTSIKYENYVNKHTPDKKYASCFVKDTGSSVSGEMVKGDDGFYYIGDKLVVVNFNHSSVSIAAMLGYGAAKYVEYTGSEVTTAVDYTNALLEYTAAASIYPMTDDLLEIVPRICAYKGWVESGYISAWTDLCLLATPSHTSDSAVTEDGYSNVYCSVCGILLSSEALAVDVYAGGGTVTVAAGSTIDCNMYFNGSMIANIVGDGNFTVTYDGNTYSSVDGAVTIPGVSSSFFTPATMQITNNGTESATYQVSFSLPLGAWSNPASLNVVDPYGNTATVAAGDQGYYFSWVATGDGTLTLTVAEDVANWDIYVQNNTSYAQSEHIFSPDGKKLEVEVAAGDDIVVVASTYNADDPYTVLAGNVVFDATFSEKQGSATNPIYIIDDYSDELDYTITYTTPEQAAEKTVYYAAMHVSGMDLTITGQGNFVAYYGGTPYMPVDGVITIPNFSATDMWTPAVVSIMGENAGTYNIVIASPVGDMMNPAELDTDLYNGNTASIVAGDQDGYYFTWTAPGEGTLTLVTSSDVTTGWVLQADNLNTYAQVVAMSTDEDTTLNIEVNEGDQIRVMANTFDPANPFTAPAGDVIFDATFYAKQGTATNPYYISDENWDTPEVEYTASVPAGETTYFGANGMTGYTMTIPADGIKVSVDGTELTAANGVYECVMPAAADPRYPVLIAITNEGAADATPTMVLVAPIGDYSNPDTLQVGKNEANVAADSWGYFYTWTAPSDGELVISMGSANWSYSLSVYGNDPDNWSDDKYYDKQWSDSDPVVATVTITVQKGNVVELSVTSYDPADPWGVPAGVVITNVEWNPVIESISVETAPKTSYTKGDALSVAGGKIKVTYADGTSESVDMTADMVSGFDGTKTGKQTLTVTYGEKTATYEVNVKAPADSSSPSTGDTEIVLWTVIASFSILALAAVVTLKKKFAI